MLPLISNICPTVVPSPDTRNESTNWIKAMRTSGLPWEKCKNAYLEKVTTHKHTEGGKNRKVHTFLSFLFASPERALLMWMLLRTSLAASGPWDTRADRKLRHWRTNLCTKEDTTLGRLLKKYHRLTFRSPPAEANLWFSEWKDACRSFMCPDTVFFTIALPTMLKWERSLAVLRRIISRLSKISIIYKENYMLWTSLCKHQVSPIQPERYIHSPESLNACLPPAVWIFLHTPSIF